MRGLHDPRWAIGLVALLFALGAPGCGEGGSPRSLDVVTVQLRWTHQAQFAGIYAAIEQGFYRDAGLEIRMLEGGHRIDLVDRVAGGTADVGVESGPALLRARDAGRDVRAVAVIYRRDPLVYLTLRSSGITKPQQFEGHTLDTEADIAPVVALATANGVDLDRIKIIHSADNVASLLSGKADIITAFVMNEPYRIRAAGQDVNVMFPDDYGVHFYADTLFTTDRYLHGNREVVQRFVTATLDGWRWAIEHAAAVPALVRRFNPDADLAHEARFIEESIPLINTGEAPIGAMSAGAWDAMARTLRRQGVVAETFDPADVYTNELIEARVGGSEAGGS